MFPVQRGQGGRGGYGIDIGSGNRSAKGNDIRIRNVLDHLSEGMQVGSHNISEDDNVIRIGLPANPNPPTQNRDDGGTGEVSCWQSLIALVQPRKRKCEKASL